MGFDNPAMVFQMLNLWNRFKKNHPKFPLFLKVAAEKGVQEGSIIEIRVTRADGESFETNLRLSADDMAMLEEMKSMKPKL